MHAVTLNGHLEKHLRLQTFPVGVRSLPPGAPLPKKAKRPAQDLGVKVAICRGDCTELTIRAHRSKEPQFILPCNGDRIFGMTADDEVAFTFPFAMAEAVVKGLEGTHAGGVRYPIPVYLKFQAQFPKSYQELERLWSGE